VIDMNLIAQPEGLSTPLATVVRIPLSELVP
jgi:hypothetical protein